MKQEFKDILDNIQYDQFYQEAFEKSEDYKKLSEELNYSEDCHKVEEESGLSVKEMAMILRDIKNIFNAKLYPNQLRIKDMPMTNWDLILTQPKFHCNNLPSERIDYKPITIDYAISETDYEIYSKWLKEKNYDKKRI